MVSPTVKVNLKASDVYANTLDGIFIENSNQIILNDVAVYVNERHGIYVTGNTDLQFINGFSISNDGDGINVNVSATELASLKLDQSIIDKNGESGIEYRSENVLSKFSMSNSKIAENTTYGLYIAGKPSAISLGFLTPANNMLFKNGSTNLVDARDANSGTIQAYGTNFASLAFPFVDANGLKNGASSLLPYWQIVNPFNSIDFGVAE